VESTVSKPGRAKQEVVARQKQKAGNKARLIKQEKESGLKKITTHI
jgi:hypothetical protein